VYFAKREGFILFYHYLEDMVKLEFYPLDVDYIDDPGRGGKGIIRIFGITADGKRVCALDDSFNHYFWVIPEEKSLASGISKKILELKVKEERRIAYATDAEIKKKKYLANEVDAIKVEVNNPKDIHILRERIIRMPGVDKDKILEIDIPFYRRYLIDKKISPLILCEVEGEEVESNYTVDCVLKVKKLKQREGELIKEPKMLAYDIEVYNKKRTPNEEKDPVLMVSFYGSGGFKKTIIWKDVKDKEKHFEIVKDEGELILKFKDVIRDFKPDYLVGYFSDGFDMPYLRARADKYKIKLDLGLDRSNVRFNRRGGNTTSKIVGFSHVDVFKFIRRVMAEKLKVPAYDLDTVGKALIGEGKKEELSIKDLHKAWDKNDKNLAKFCEYNMTDAELTYKLAKIMSPHLHEFVKLVGLPPDDVCRMSYGQLVENYVLRNISEFNEISPNRPFHDKISGRMKETFEGAFVYTPEAGLYKEVVVFDFKSLYPTIISVHNICPSTLTDNKKEANVTPDIEIGNRNVHYYFSYKHDGIFPKIVKEILTRRNRVKEMMKGNKKDPVLYARQYGLKTIANSLYGYFAFFGARWYCKECAAAITAYGRDYIKKVISQAEKKDFKVIYGDTDSVFISLGDEKSKKDALDFLKEVNRELPSLMELEFDGYYPRGLFVMKKGEEHGAKKKYALIDEEGDIKVTGFETIRGDWSEIAKDVQSKVFEIILRENDVEKALKYVREIVKKIREKKIDVEMMVIKKQLKKEIESYEAVGPHVSVAKKLRDRGEYVSSGSVIKYVIQEGKGKIGDRAIPADEAKDYDAEYYVTHQVIPVVKKIFEVLGHSVEEMSEDHKQKSLGDY